MSSQQDHGVPKGKVPMPEGSLGLGILQVLSGDSVVH